MTSSDEMANPTFVAAVVASLAGHGGVDADDAAAAVDERTAGVARRDRGVGLDEAVEGALLGDDRAVERRHDAERHASGRRRGRGRTRSPATSSPMRDLRRRCERHRLEVVAVDAQQGEVVAGVGGDDRRPSIGSVSPARRTWIDVGAVDDVGVREDLAVGGDDHAGADGAALRLLGADRDHRRPDGVDDRRGRACRRRPSATTSGPSATGHRRRCCRSPTPISTPAMPAANAAPATATSRPDRARSGAPGRRARRARLDPRRGRRQHRHGPVSTGPPALRRVGRPREIIAHSKTRRLERVVVVARAGRVSPPASPARSSRSSGSARRRRSRTSPCRSSTVSTAASTCWPSGSCTPCASIAIGPNVTARRRACTPPRPVLQPVSTSTLPPSNVSVGARTPAGIDETASLPITSVSTVQVVPSSGRSGRRLAVEQRHGRPFGGDRERVAVERQRRARRQHRGQPGVLVHQRRRLARHLGLGHRRPTEHVALDAPRTRQRLQPALAARLTPSNVSDDLVP